MKFGKKNMVWCLAVKIPLFRLLIIEDNRSFRKMFIENLNWSFSSLTIEEADDGLEALGKIAESPPDLIITDWRLPKIGGLELIQKMKKDFPHIPVIIMSGYDLPEYREAALKEGVEAFFVKGSPMEEEIEAFLEKRFPDQLRLTEARRLEKETCR